tara:strand:- start:654 stop:977 length:324 start_codon:yes stop_codon:yes gene_type:complete
MNTNKYTNGPWIIADETGHITPPASLGFDPEPSFMIATSDGGDGTLMTTRTWIGATPSYGNGEANARLMAAAPEMLEALVELVERGNTLPIAVAAIAKATGKPEEEK